MRLKHPDGHVVHVAYCTNVHPAETVEGLSGQLQTYAAQVRRTLGVEVLGVGLWLPARAAQELAEDPAGVERLRGQLARLGLEVVTLNAFPYASFGEGVVKKEVYLPDWSDQRRLDYTLDCARVLAGLLPDDAARGSISSLPLGWRQPWFSDRQNHAEQLLGQLAEGLTAIKESTGRTIRVGLEPEPGCIVDSTHDVAERLSALDHDHIGVCLDTCHLATAFETGAEALERVRAVGLDVVKVQASAALHAQKPGSAETKAALQTYAEDRYLHQVREKLGSRVLARDDLDEALGGDRPLPGRSPWRVHFHVPLHAEPAAPLASTRDHLVDALAALVAAPGSTVDHIEAETYTWSVLPEHARPCDDGSLVRGIAAELRWLHDRLVGLGLEAVTGRAA